MKIFRVSFALALITGDDVVLVIEVSTIYETILHNYYHQKATLPKPLQAEEQTQKK